MGTHKLRLTTSHHLQSCFVLSTIWDQVEHLDGGQSATLPVVCDQPPLMTGTSLGTKHMAWHSELRSAPAIASLRQCHHATPARLGARLRLHSSSSSSSISSSSSVPLAISPAQIGFTRAMFRACGSWRSAPTSSHSSPFRPSVQPSTQPSVWEASCMQTRYSSHDRISPRKGVEEAGWRTPLSVRTGTTPRPHPRPLRPPSPPPAVSSASRPLSHRSRKR